MPLKSTTELSAKKKIFLEYYDTFASDTFASDKFASDKFASDKFAPSEILKVSQYYNQKYNIKIHVQINDDNDFLKKRVDDVKRIQSNLAPSEYAAYIGTEGMDLKKHVELILISRDRIVKPLIWGNPCYFPGLSASPDFSSANFNHMMGLFSDMKGRGLGVQADGSSCGSLCLVYAKELLKENANQLVNLTLDIPYFLMFKDRESLRNLFIPSPQVLRYSQSTLYNHYIEAMIINEEPGEFHYNSEKIKFTTVQYLLKQILTYEAASEELKKQVSFLLEELPAFRLRWNTEYALIQISRSLMKSRSGYNLGLFYTGHRLHKIAILEQQKQHDLLINEIKEKKETLSAQEILDFCTEKFKPLQCQIAYFLNQLYELNIDESIFFLFIDMKQYLFKDNVNFVYLLHHSVHDKIKKHLLSSTDQIPFSSATFFSPPIRRNRRLAIASDQDSLKLIGSF